MAAVLAGSQLSSSMATLCIGSAVGAAVVSLVALKLVFDVIKEKREGLTKRYVAIMGRVMALITGTFAVEMILDGLEIWIKALDLG